MYYRRVLYCQKTLATLNMLQMTFLERGGIHPENRSRDSDSINSYNLSEQNKNGAHERDFQSSRKIQSCFQNVDIGSRDSYLKRSYIPPEQNETRAHECDFQSSGKEKFRGFRGSRGSQSGHSSF